jgi:hypothetical protein
MAINAQRAVSTCTVCNEAFEKQQKLLHPVVQVARIAPSIFSRLKLKVPSTVASVPFGNCEIKHTRRFQVLGA